MSHRQVVITGAGCISPLGVHLDELGAAMAEGRSGVGEIASFDAAPYRCRHGAEVLDLELSDFLESTKTYIDRTSAFTLAACADALRQAGWRGDESVGLVLGTAWGCLDSLELFSQKLFAGKPRFVSALPFTHSYANAPNSLAAIEFKLRGFSACLTCGNTAGAAAVEYACRRIRLGRDARLLAGGAEALSEPIHQACSRRDELSIDGTAQPYEPESSGMLLGEGAAVFALEDAAAAAARGAEPLARLLGCGSANGATVADGLRRAMRQALADAALEPRHVNLVVGIGNGHPDLDAAEERALDDVFGRGVCSLATIKALTGEALGAGGPLSLAAALCWLGTGAPSSVLVDGEPSAAGLIHGGTAVVNAADPSGAAVSLVVAAP